MHDEAIDQLGQALRLAEERGADDTQAHTHHALAQAWEAKNDYQKALIHATLSLRLHHGLDNEQWLAIALNGAGWSLAHVGRYREASEHCENALALYRKHRNVQGEATTLSSLGYIAQHTNQPDQALAYYGEAVSLLHKMGNDYEEADTLSLLGETQALLYQYDEARATWRRALSLYEAQQRMSEARRIHRRLDELSMQSK
jgi:tetratricopeptide (TPR) repeat protein